MINMPAKYLELTVLVTGGTESHAIIYAELIGEEPEMANWEKPEYGANTIIDKAGLLDLLPEGVQAVSEPEFTFAEHVMDGIISDKNEKRARDGRKAWIWLD